MSIDISRERLADLLVNPREYLHIEVKNWLDLRESKEDKATFAKAVLAISNHGGGFVIFGFCDKDMVEAEGRPASFDGYSQDVINGIVRNYCDPPFHCEVHFVQDPAKALFPIVVIPGGHRVPVRARRAGPNGKIVEKNAIYIRKPGPCSEMVQTSQEWDELLGRCLRNKQDEMRDQFRDIFGTVPSGGGGG